MAGESQTAVANSLGISVETVGHWYTKAQSQLDDQDEVTWLKEELCKVKAENEFFLIRWACGGALPFSSPAMM